jgi:hypothetical protein
MQLVSVGAASGRAGQAVRGTSACPSLADDAAQKTVGTRYMGAKEAKAVEADQGTIPAHYESGEPRKIHYTTDPPTRSAAQAKQKYMLKTTPTHMCQFPLCNVQDKVPPDGLVAPWATQAATSKPIHGASKPEPLDP